MTATTDPRVQATRYRVDTWLAAQDQHDFDTLAAAYAEDAIAESPGPQGWDQAKGRAIIREWAEKQYEWLPDAKGPAARMFVAPDVAIVELVLLGTNTGPMWDGGPSSGRRVGLRSCNVITFDARGLIVRERSYLDTNTLGVQLKGKIQDRSRAFPALPAQPPPSFAVMHDAQLAPPDWVSVWSRKDAASYSAELEDEAVHEDIAQPDDVVGRAANVAELDAFARALPDLRITTENAWSTDRFRVVEYVLSGTQLGDFRGIAPTGKPMTIHAVDIDEVTGGRLVRRTTYSNALEWLRQLGVRPPHKPGPDEPGARPQ